jgi:hypothetical protein
MGKSGMREQGSLGHSAHTHGTHARTSASVELEALKDRVDMRETISRAR